MTFLWSPLEIPEVDSTELVERLLVAAHQELGENGILGFRTQSVATRASCSISLIYRYFENRDGLIIRVVGDLFDTLQREHVDLVFNYFAGLDVIRPSDISNVIPHLDQNAQSTNMHWRLLALALSRENGALRARLETSIRSVIPKWQSTLEMIASKAPPGETLDLRVFTMILSMHLPYYNSLFGEFRVKDADFKAYLEELLHFGNPEQK
jgi:AcrR family transcriptional regulator